MTPSEALARSLLRRVTSAQPPPFALLRRQRPDGGDDVEVLVGEVRTVAALADIPLPAEPAGGGARHEAFALIPFRQIAERRFACTDDGTPLTVMTVREQGRLPLATALDLLPNVPVALEGARFDVDDEAYADLVRRVVRDEIGRGEGANFVIRRSFVADVPGYSPAVALSFFRRLLTLETGTHWTFVHHTGERTLVGATPERHITVDAGRAVMNPISGTYRYPPSGPRADEVVDFLADQKETDELYMVVDEELKMMSRVCDGGGRLVGPRLKEMARLAHTEYLIEGRTTRDVRAILRDTMFAPTVTGSPLESACRVIGRYEPTGRGYYSGVAALIGRDARGGRCLDSAILIRTADIDADGRMSIGVGATLVRHSDPASEVAETRAKAAGLLAALAPRAEGGLEADPRVREALAGRNEPLSPFWLDPARSAPSPEALDLEGRRVLVIDAEDDFTAMMCHLIRSFGMDVTLIGHREPDPPDGHDLVVMGPGPGDPRDEGDPRIARVGELVRWLLDTRRPFLAVCLSHQVLSRTLGLPVARMPQPNQGVRRRIDLFGRSVRVGFYNSFAAYADSDKFEHDAVPGVIEVSRDPRTGEVHGLRGPGFRSIQFHAESVLSRDGVGVVQDLLAGLLATRPAAARRR
ncbi:anthranilate synthase family protein [Thermomonospora umbrina]|uniref:anthranilate synthase n=1 Tax=Thermomonospora umbrina TaxID=111806 RepID=A0A3D9SSX9_9ACTN|nr:anthranilate synthase family protein [Thermomonospora umbrina]REE99052.1 phenazine biosynthesis protein phzE [Thermomonospora umbrina]